MLYKEILPDHDKGPVILLGNPVYLLLPSYMKEFPNAHNKRRVIFNNMLRGEKNRTECAFHRLKARGAGFKQAPWHGIDISVPNIVYACFILRNICEKVLQSMMILWLSTLHKTNAPSPKLKQTVAIPSILLREVMPGM